MLFKNLIKSLANNNVCKRYLTNSSIQSVFDSKRLQRTHYCGNLSAENDGQEVRLCGWLQSVRSKNFILIRDVEGIVQVYLDDDLFSKNKNHPSFQELKEESVVSIIGRVRRRPKGQENLKMKTGQIEVKCDKIELLNESKSSLPFTITDLNSRPTEQVRLKYRYLDLRFDDMQHNLILRSNFVHSIRNFMKENKFFEIETPTLFRRTPGGAREFLVPTNRSEYFYCLTQSPQQFKQLLMVAGFDRYYQIARCYRDETSKQDRQPEFTQVDIEMSFVNENDIINLIETMLVKCWPFEKLKTPFRRMKYDDAINFYGVDKPDLRFDMKFLNLSDDLKKMLPTGITKIDSQLQSESFHVYGFKINQEYEPDLLDINQIEKEYKLIYKDTHFANIDQLIKESFVFLVMDNNKNGNHITKYMNENVKSELLFNRFNLKENEKCVIIMSKHKSKLLEILGKMRLRLADLIDEKKIQKNYSHDRLIRDPKKFEFLWVVDFPLFSINEETNRLESTHHPFTAPIGDHLNLVREMKDLEKVTGLHYDIVLNGSEIGGGSIRIHNSQLQRHILNNILQEDTEQLEHLLNALEYGAPPHGGIALGLDRLVAIMCGTPNIRNVIAFPKAQSGRDLMSSAPSKVNKSELDYYKIKCVE